MQNLGDGTDSGITVCVTLEAWVTFRKKWGVIQN
jgi:hypothetical protein